MSPLVFNVHQLERSGIILPLLPFLEILYFRQSLFEELYEWIWGWMALKDGNFLQSDRSIAGSWPWGRACVSPLAEDKYAAVLRRCSAGSWFPLRHFSQVISLSLHCSLFSAGIRMRSEWFQTRLRWMSGLSWLWLYQSIVLTLSWFVEVESSWQLINSEFKSRSGIQTSNFLICPLEGCYFLSFLYQ